MKKKHKKRLRKLLFESIKIQIDRDKQTSGADPMNLSGIAESARVLRTL